jgi:methyl-accepting chemotaxis protein
MVVRVLEFFLGAYSDGNYLLKARSKLLFFFMSAFFILLVILQGAMGFVGIDAFLRVLRVTPLFFISIIVSLIFLKKGRYHASANVFVFMGAAGLVAGIISNSFIKPDVVYTTYIYFIFLPVAFCTIFCTPAVLAAVAGILACADIAAFFLVRMNTDSSYHPALKLALIDTLITYVIFFILAMFTMIIFRRNAVVARDETKKNVRQNVFIRETLRSNSEALVAAARKIESRYGTIAANTQNQAASTEEVTAAVEEISAGIDSVSDSAGGQNRNIEALLESMKTQSSIMGEINAEVSDANARTGRITDRARDGEKSFRMMDESIASISKSSAEMSEIIAIINDISDRINLLSLNAAIEAARAGDAGRGFAVVADEISKLADKTASSIQEIDRLIRENEAEIRRGADNIKGSVVLIGGIISDIGEIGRTINNIFTAVGRQNETGESVNRDAGDVGRRAAEIMNATEEQKHAMDEVVRTVSMINDYAQMNSIEISEMIEESRNLIAMIEDMNATIEEYREG